MSFHDEDSEIMLQKRANYIDIPGRSDQFSLMEYLQDIMSDRDLERNAEGGRIEMQEGGSATFEEMLAKIRESYPDEMTQFTRPGPFAEALQGVFAPLLARFLGTPTDPSGGTNIFGQEYGSFLPRSESQNPLQQQAIRFAAMQAGMDPSKLEFDSDTGAFKGFGGQEAGVAGFQPFLDRATGIANAAQAAAQRGQGAGRQNFLTASGLAGLAGQAARAGQDAGMQDLAGARGTIDEMLAAARAGQGAGTADFEAARRLSGGQGFDEFMSPYQQEVIDATMAQLQEELGAQQAALGTSAGSAFGGGRFGVAQGQLAAQGALNKALTGAQLRSQGFTQAQNAASRAAAQRMGLGQAEMQQAAQNVGLLQPGLAGQFQAGQQAMQQAGQNVNLLGAAGGQQLAAGQGLGQQAARDVGLLGSALGMQTGLAQLQPQLAAQQMNLFNQLGTQQQAIGQAGLDSLLAGNRMIAMMPQQQMGFFGGMLPYFGGGASYYQQPMDSFASPMSQLLGGIAGIGGTIGSIAGLFN